ncbi:helix-hairpin-helix domain-containing protein [candidate division WOR-3 bacterium]|nr:helix-hairpin-helix domain-containing protein [candidate division WOR-3 bacterium]
MILLFLIFLVYQEFEAPQGNEDLIDELGKLEQHPIQLNKAKKENFLRIYWISPELAKSIIETRNKIGGFKKVEDLNKVLGLTDETLELIKPYVTVGAIHKSPLLFELRARVKESFPRESGKLGDPWKTYERLKLRYRNLSGVLLLEKDYYEESYGDFITGGIMLQLNKRFPKFVLGDYKLEFGEGLLFGYPPLITFKNQGMIKSRERGIRLYTNAGENTYLRGLALESRISSQGKNFIFCSRTLLDGKVEDGEVFIYYDYESDHSTESGLDKRDRIREELLGTRFEWSGMIKLGVTGYKNSHFLNPEGTKLGTHKLFGADFSYKLAKTQWFGELGRCDTSWRLSSPFLCKLNHHCSTEWAWVTGVEYKRGKLKLGALSRYYPSHFYVFHSSPWADRSVTTGGLAEKGNYLYIGYKISKSTKFSGYFDVFTRLPKIYSQELPEQGVKYSSEIEHKFTKQFSITSRYSFKSLGISRSNQFRLQADIGVKNIDMRVRGEKGYETDGREGELLYGDINFKFLRNLSVSTRLILFDSNLSKFKLYEYERDLPGLMTNRVIAGKGSRAYFIIKGRVASICELGLKYEITSKFRESPTQRYSIQLDLEI